MNPDDDDSVINQLKHPRFMLDIIPKLGVSFVKSIENRRYRQSSRPENDLQVYAEDELIRKQFKELRCEMPGTPRSTFLMVFSPDGTKVASTHGNHNIYITDLRNGKNVRTLVGHPRTPWCIAFHPICNELVASGCLGGQVRIWDLSGGSEVWTASSQTVIASIAFHPNDRLLVIATYNELYFWDWSKPKPFRQITTCNTKEKVRYVAFDKLGHKLITGIANTPQSRWERSRANLPPNRAERIQTPNPVMESRIFPFRRGTSPRGLPTRAPQPSTSVANHNINTNTTPTTNNTSNSSSSNSTRNNNNTNNNGSGRGPLSTIPERERRITACYRNLVQEYELLVHRYLQVYRPPTTTDRGTDPMEQDYVNSQSTNNAEAQASTSDVVTQYPSIDAPLDRPTTSGTNNSPRRRLVLRTSMGVQTTPDDTTNLPVNPRRCTEREMARMRIKCAERRRTAMANKRVFDLQKALFDQVRSKLPSRAEASTSGQTRQQLKQEVFLNQTRMKLKRVYPGFIKKAPKHNRKLVVETSSDNTSSDEEGNSKRSFNLPNPAVTASETVANAQGTDSAASSWTQTYELNDEDQGIGNTADIPSVSTNIDKLVCLTKFVASGGSMSSPQPGTSAQCRCERCDGSAEPQNSEAPSTSSSGTTRVDISTSTPIRNRSNATETPRTSGGCARTNSLSQPCARTLMNTDTRTTNSTVYTPSSGPRRRFFSHVFSAFLPPRLQNVAPQRMREEADYSPHIGVPFDAFMPESARLTLNYASDEVINYSERVNSEDDLGEQILNLNDFHPFDPPPEFPSINPENIGIGNMYSNIVQDLESSLNNVRNMRASNRPGETSDMLSSFSERLESIMNQSDSILRNLSHTIDTLPSNSEQNEARRPQRRSPAVQLPSPRSLEAEHPRFLFNDPNFYVRDAAYNQDRRALNRSDLLETGNSNQPQEELFSNRSAIASDHTYPRNPENPRPPPTVSDSLTPLMTSLHLTISHIQRQARLLRRQVDSIERIDRAMLEVAQLQLIRQMFGEMRRHLNNLTESDNRSAGVSSVRQMMAGTRISDSSPYDSAEEDVGSHSLNEEGSQTSNAPTESLPVNPNAQTTRPRVSSRRSFQPSRLLQLQRVNRRFSVVNFGSPRRFTTRDRLTRRRVYFRAFSLRPSNIRITNEQTRFGQDPAFYISTGYLSEITRCLEQFLTDHIRTMGTNSTIFVRDPVIPGSDARETIVIKRLNACRLRMNRLIGLNGDANLSNRTEISNVTPHGSSRLNARDTLTTILDTFSRFFDENRNYNLSHAQRTQIRNVIDLTSLLSDILLLHIVDSIPPPTGMNLDPERESLSARIDHMCSRMLQSRLSGQSHSLTRSLRLMRLTVRYASRALGQTYNARRNAIFSSGNNSRRELIGQINRTLHMMHRNRGMSYTPIEIPPSPDPLSSDMPMRDWFRTINALVSRYNTVTNQDPLASLANSGANRNPRRRSFIYEDLTNSDENDDADPDWYNNHLASNDRRQLLYRTNNVNLLNVEPAPLITSNRPWNVPTVQINDVPISESNSAWHSRLTQHRYRLSDLRSSPSSNLFRPRFLHPLYGGVNPFDADIDDPQREQIYDGDMVLTVTPNHRIQAWDMSNGSIPDISNPILNVVVSECKIHNDASVDLSSDGTILVTLLPSGGYLNVTNRLGVYSLRWETLGQCLYMTSFEQNAVSVSLSPLNRYLVVGLASRRVSIVPNDKWTMARIFLLNRNEMPYGSRLPVVRELEQNRDTNYMSLNCIRWLPMSGQGLIYATNTGQLRIIS